MIQNGHIIYSEPRHNLSQHGHFIYRSHWNNRLWKSNQVHTTSLTKMNLKMIICKMAKNRTHFVSAWPHSFWTLYHASSTMVKCRLELNLMHSFFVDYRHTQTRTNTHMHIHIYICVCIYNIHIYIYIYITSEDSIIGSNILYTYLKTQATGQIIACLQATTTDILIFSTQNVTMVLEVRPRYLANRIVM